MGTLSDTIVLAVFVDSLQYTKRFLAYILYESHRLSTSHTMMSPSNLLPRAHNVPDLRSEITHNCVKYENNFV